MRKILFAALLGISGVALACAGTFIPLLTPDNAVAFPGFPSSHGCNAGTFAVNDTAHGYCYRTRSTACSGRGCQPVQNSEYFKVSWDIEGNPFASVFCATRRHHNPQPDVWVYEPGFDATNCHAPALTSATTVLIGDQYYFYYDTSTSGQYELLRGTAGPFIYQF